MRVAIICEGSTDFPVLTAVIEAAIGHPIVASLIQPDFDALLAGKHSTAPGWQGVRAFLASGDVVIAAAAHDVVVIQVDADVRHAEGNRRQLRRRADGEEELGPLCDLVRGWSKRPLPEAAVVTLPRESTEAWLLALHTNQKSVETISRAAKALAYAGLIDTADDGQPNKLARRYSELARPIGRLVKSPSELAKKLPELERFVGKLRARETAIRRSRSSEGG